MEIEWVREAIISFQETIDYWDNRNKSTTYSDKIIDAVEREENKIKENPYFLAKYREKIQLYQKTFLNGKFSLYYDIDSEHNIVRIIYFRSNRQKPIY